MYLNPVLSFLYWKMEYHVTHHMFPTVPSYNLDKLHHHIKDQLPRTKRWFNRSLQRNFTSV